jgi:glycosyltransferase involved in cell wall biosynthesis
VFINVARIDKVKNQQLIIDTMKILEAESENAIALIVGGYIPEDKELYDQLVQNRLKAKGKCLYQKEFSMKSCAAKYDKLYHSNTVH